MRKALCICLAVAVMLGIFTGCQPTPEQPLVVSKNTENLLKKAQAEETAQTHNESTAVNLYERLNAPQNYETDLTSKTGNLSVHVDAQVVLPDCEIPIYRIRPALFSTEQVKVFTKQPPIKCWRVRKAMAARKNTYPGG